MLQLLSSKTSSHITKMSLYQMYGFIGWMIREKMWKDDSIIIVGSIAVKQGNYSRSWIKRPFWWKDIRVISILDGFIWRKWEIGEMIQGEKYIWMGSVE